MDIRIVIHKILPPLGAAALLAALAAGSAAAMESARTALSLCTQLIIPSLFPFMTAAYLLSGLGIPAQLGRFFAARGFGSGAGAFLMGILGGYPLGAAAAAELYRQGCVTKEEAERMLGWCNNSGAAFILGAVGTGVFGDIRWGLLLYLCHILSALCTAMVIGRQKGPTSAPPAVPVRANFAAALSDAVIRAAQAMLSVCGAVVFFRVVGGLAEEAGLVGALALLLGRCFGWELRGWRALLYGLLEIGGGVGAMAGLAPTPGALALAAFLLGWGGISVHFQTRAVAADLRLARHALGKLISACIAAILAGILALIL